MMLKGIIFDLDGVLLSTDEFHYEGWKKLSDKYSLEFDRSINTHLRGVSRMESLEVILRHSNAIFTQEEKEKMAEEKNNTYKLLLEKLSPKDVSKEVRETLDELKKRGYKLAIGSSSKNAKYILERTNLISSFEAISDGTNIINSKPDPEVFLKAAEMLGLEKSSCAVIEDAEAGLIAAKAASMYAVAINDAYGSSNADVSIKDFKELEGIFN